MSRIAWTGILALVTAGAAAQLPATRPGGNWGNLPYLSQVNQAANQLFFHVEQLRVAAASLRHPQANALQRQVENYYQELLNFTRFLQRNPNQPQVEAEYGRVDRRSDEVVAALRSIAPNPQTAQLLRYASRIETADHQLGAAVQAGGSNPPQGGGNLVRLTRSLDSQSNDLLRIARDTLRNDPFGQRLEREIGGFSKGVDRFRRHVETRSPPEQVQRSYADLASTWSGIAQALSSQNTIWDAHDLRQSAGQVNSLVATLGRLIGGTQPGPFPPNPLPPTPPIGSDRRRSFVAVGADAGGGSRVRVLQTNPPVELADFLAYDPDFRGGVRVAVGDVDGDGVRDIITAPGPGAPPVVRVIGGRDLNLIREFMAFEGNYRNGVWIAAADINRNGRTDIVCGTDQGGIPVIRVFDAVSAQRLAEFAAYEPAFRGGVRVAVGDINGDGVPDIVAAPGPGRPPTIRVFDGRNPANILSEFNAYAPNWTGGAFVAVGNFTNDGRREIVTGADAGGGPHVRMFEGLTGRPLLEFFPFDQAFRGGVRVACSDVDGDRVPDILCAPGPGIPTTIRIFSGRTGQLVNNLDPFEPWWAGGAFVGCK